MTEYATKEQVPHDGKWTLTNIYRIKPGETLYIVGTSNGVPITLGPATVRNTDNRGMVAFAEELDYKAGIDFKWRSDIQIYRKVPPLADQSAILLNSLRHPSRGRMVLSEPTLAVRVATGKREVETWYFSLDGKLHSTHSFHIDEWDPVKVEVEIDEPRLNFGF